MSIWREFTTTCTTGSEMSKLKCLPCGTPVAVLRQLSDKSMAGPARSLEYALLASIALHGVALFGISSMKESATERAASSSHFRRYVSGCACPQINKAPGDQEQHAKANLFQPFDHMQ